jgi:hypothetical protein
LAQGLPRQRVDHRLRNRSVIAPFRGVHVDAARVADFRTRCRAALVSQGLDAVLAMQSSAFVLGVRWLPAEWSRPDAVVHVAVPPQDAHRHRSGLRLHRRTLRPGEIVLIDGMPCMSPVRTLVELARDFALSQVLVVQIIDGARRDGLVTIDGLHACLAQMPGERGVARARELVELSRHPVDSPQETSMRLALWFEGIRDLEVGIEICEYDGVVLARGDLGSRRWLIWSEYDGYDAHTQRPTFRGDRVGDRWLQRRGWHVMRFVDTDLRQRGRLVADWRQALADAPRRIGALAKGLSPEADQARRDLGLPDRCLRS